jgi:PAS domain S-box-containing protein
VSGRPDTLAAFQSRLGDRLRDLPDAWAIAGAAAQMVGERLNAGRVVYAVVDEAGENGVVEAAWTAGALAELAGTHPLGELGAGRQPGEIHRVDDIAPAVNGGAAGAAGEAFAVRAVLAVPLLRGGRLCALLAAHSPAPRRWTDAEVALLRDVGERVWAETARARAQAALQASETRHRMIVEGARDYAIYTADEQGRIDSWPPGAEAVFGWTAQEAIGQPTDITFVPEDRGRGAPQTELEVAREQGTAGDVRWHLRKDGSRVFIDGTTRALRGANGELSFLKIGQDVTLRRAAEAALRDSEGRQRFLLTLGDRLRELDDPREVASAAAELLGEHMGVDRVVYAEVDEAGEHASIVAEWTHHTLPSVLGLYRLDDFGVGDCYRHGHMRWSYDTRAEMRGRTGADRYEALGIRAAVGTPILKGGRLSAVLAAHHAVPREWTEADVELVRDVGDRAWAEAERARAQAALRDSEARHRMIVEGARGYAIFTTDDQRRIETWPPGAQAVFGWTAAEAIGQPVDVLFVPEDRASGEPEKEIATARARGVAPDVRWHLRKDGSRVFIEGSMRAIHDAGGVVRFVKMGQDATRRHRAEAALRESEARFRLLFDSIDEGFCIVEVLFDEAGKPADYRFVEVNPAFGRHTGLAGAAGKTMRALAPAHEELWFETYGRIAATGEPARFEARAESLGGRWYDVGAFRIGDPAQGRVAVLLRDVTAQKEAGAALERAHAELEQRVAERTAELAIANEVLATQIAQREALEHARDELLRQLARAEEQERLRLSRELHDQMGQLVAALLLGLRSLAPGPGPAPGALGELERLAEQIAREVHSVALELRPPSLDRLGLRRALEAHLNEWAERHGIAGDFQAVGIEDERFGPEIETTLFRAVQEGLTNAARHAGAAAVSLVLERRPGSVAVILEDDGRGFDVEAATSPAGGGRRLGLLGMQERARLLGGVIEIESAPGAGTTLFVRLPVRDDGHGEGRGE